MRESHTRSACAPQRGAHMGPLLRLGPEGWKIFPSPSSLQKIIPIPSHHHLHLGLTSLTVYSPYERMYGRSNGMQYIGWVQRWASCEIRGGCVCGPFRWTIMWAPSLVRKMCTGAHLHYIVCVCMCVMCGYIYIYMCVCVCVCV